MALRFISRKNKPYIGDIDDKLKDEDGHNYQYLYDKKVSDLSFTIKSNLLLHYTYNYKQYDNVSVMNVKKKDVYKKDKQYYINVPPFNDIKVLYINEIVVINNIFNNIMNDFNFNNINDNDIPKYSINMNYKMNNLNVLITYEDKKIIFNNYYPRLKKVYCNDIYLNVSQPIKTLILCKNKVNMDIKKVNAKLPKIKKIIYNNIYYQAIVTHQIKSWILYITNVELEDDEHILEYHKRIFNDKYYKPLQPYYFTLSNVDTLIVHNNYSELTFKNINNLYILSNEEPFKDVKIYLDYSSRNILFKLNEQNNYVKTMFKRIFVNNVKNITIEDNCNLYIYNPNKIRMLSIEKKYNNNTIFINIGTITKPLWKATNIISLINNKFRCHLNIYYKYIIDNNFYHIIFGKMKMHKIKDLFVPDNIENGYYSDNDKMNYNKYYSKYLFNDYDFYDDYVENGFLSNVYFADDVNDEYFSDYDNDINLKYNSNHHIYKRNIENDWYSDTSDEENDWSDTFDEENDLNSASNEENFDINNFI